MRINCICCGHRFDLDDAYDDYEGLLRCPTCAGMLNVKIQDGAIKSMMPGSFEAPPTLRIDQAQQDETPGTGGMQEAA